MPTKNRFSIPKDKSSLGNRPIGRNLWAYAQWTDALTTVRYAVKNRPNHEDGSPVTEAQEDG